MTNDILRAIEARRAEIAVKADALRVEDAELAVAERALRRLQSNDAGAKHKPAQGAPKAGTDAEPPRRGRTPKFGGKSQRELILAVLAQSKDAWVDTATILSSVKATSGIVLPKKTVSPLLSVMRREGVIMRQGRTVALAQRALPVRTRSRSRAA